jgi:uncharacterized protein (DUF2147 family)
MGLRQAIRSANLAAAGLGLIGCLQAANASPSSVDGSWKIRDLVLEIFNCQQLVCGKVAWTKDPHRRQTDCGQTIVWGLNQTGPAEWSGGSIYDPTDGNTYALSASLERDGTLHARIYRGVPLFGKTEILTRVASRSLSGWCS